MKIAIYANDTDHSKAVKKQLLEKLHQASIEIDAVHPEIVLTIGGDGTVLHAVHQYLEQLENIQFMGIHTGHLGYYTDWLPDELDDLIHFIKQEDHQISEYPLLEVILKADGTQYLLYALNEITILNALRTQHLNITIEDLFFESFRGTGICLATPTGSTAYNKSLGGAVLYPSIEAFQMTEIASINSNVYRTIGSPLIIPKDQTITIQSENFQDITITRDHLSTNYQNINQISVTLSSRKVKFAQREEGLFWERIKNHFL